MDIHWSNRYSDTLERDNLGRWARVAYVGKEDNFGFEEMRVARFQIAWISKGITHPYVVDFDFPQTGVTHFETLDEAKWAVRERFEWFLKHCQLTP